MIPRMLAIGATLLLSVSCAAAYEIGTHHELVGGAARRSVADQVLKEDLEFGAGILNRVQGKSLEGWLGKGAANEDNFPRFLNHFHNPLASNWSDAGLGGSVGQSAILWAQNPSQSAPSWSWRDVRQAIGRRCRERQGEYSHAGRDDQTLLQGIHDLAAGQNASPVISGEALWHQSGMGGHHLRRWAE